MSDKLPSFKKSLKSFILEEDAKLIDKTSSKVALTAAFLSLNFVFTIDDANAKGHKDHANHSNFIEHAGSDQGLINTGDDSVSKTYTHDQFSAQVEIPAKSVASAHANHYNHQNGGGKS